MLQPGKGLKIERKATRGSDFSKCEVGAYNSMFSGVCEGKLP